MQLTNVARDVAEDWARGRLHLPRSMLGGAFVRPSVPDVAWAPSEADDATLPGFEAPSQ